MSIPVLDFPKEIRDQIYSDILAPTTQFTLCRSAQDKDIPVSYPSTRLPRNDKISTNILQTCHQVHRETKDLFWAQNTLIIFPKPGEDVERETFLSMLSKVQKAALHFDLDSDNFNYVRKDSMLLAIYSRALKSLRFVIEAGDGEEGSPLLTRFRELAYHGLRASNSRWMARILEEMRRDIVGEGVDVKLMFEFGLGTLDAGTISKMRADGCEDHLMEMHDILGAEVWVDGAMCYQDGKAVKKALPTIQLPSPLLFAVKVLYERIPASVYIAQRGICLEGPQSHWSTHLHKHERLQKAKMSHAPKIALRRPDPRVDLAFSLTRTTKAARGPQLNIVPV